MRKSKELLLRSNKVSKLPSNIYEELVNKVKNRHS